MTSLDDLSGGPAGRYRIERELGSEDKSREVRTPGWRAVALSSCGLCDRNGARHLGEKAEAIRWLERTGGDGMPAYDLFAGEPALATLKGTPGFDALMRRLRADSEAYRKAYRESRWSARR